MTDCEQRGSCCRSYSKDFLCYIYCAILIIQKGIQRCNTMPSPSLLALTWSLPSKCFWKGSFELHVKCIKFYTIQKYLAITVQAVTNTTSLLVQDLVYKGAKINSIQKKTLVGFLTVGVHGHPFRNTIFPQLDVTVTHCLFLCGYYLGGSMYSFSLVPRLSPLRRGRAWYILSRPWCQG